MCWSRPVSIRSGVMKEVLDDGTCGCQGCVQGRIYEVPGAPQDVRGILFYEGLPVDIRRIGDGAPVCGIIMDGCLQSHWGIAGEPAGEEAIHAEELVRVMPAL